MKIASLLSAALITLPLALFAAPNPFDDVNLKGSTDKANPVGYKIGERADRLYAQDRESCRSAEGQPLPCPLETDGR